MEPIDPLLPAGETARSHTVHGFQLRRYGALAGLDIPLESADAGYLLRKADPRLIFAHGLFGVSLRCDVLGIKDDAADVAAGFMPRLNLPTDPLLAPIGAQEPFSPMAFRRAGQAAPMNLAPLRRNLREYFIVAAPHEVLRSQLEILPVAPAGGQVPHFAVEHGDSHRRGFGEAQQVHVAGHSDLIRAGGVLGELWRESTPTRVVGPIGRLVCALRPIPFARKNSATHVAGQSVG